MLQCKTQHGKIKPFADACFVGGDSSILYEGCSISSRIDPSIYVYPQCRGLPERRQNNPQRSCYLRVRCKSFSTKHFRGI